MLLRTATDIPGVVDELQTIAEWKPNNVNYISQARAKHVLPRSKTDDSTQAGGDEVIWQVEPPTAKLALNATLTGSPSTMPVSMMRGECEHRQIVLASDVAELRDISVHVHTGDASPALDASWSFKQVGYVNCTANADLRGTTSGWWPDILLDAPDGSAPGVVVELVTLASIQPIWVELCTPENASVGNHSGTLTVAGTRAVPGAHRSDVFHFSVSFSVEIWDIVMPRLGSRGSISTAFQLDGDETAPQTRLDGLAKYYPNYHAGSAIQERVYEFLAEHRIPADEIYTGPHTVASGAVGMRPASAYIELLGNEGMRVMTLMDVSIFNNSDRTWPHVLSQDFIDGIVSTVNRSLEQLGLGSSKQPGLLPAALAASIIADRRLRICKCRPPLPLCAKSRSGV